MEKYEHKYHKYKAKYKKLKSKLTRKSGISLQNPKNLIGGDPVGNFYYTNPINYKINDKVNGEIDTHEYISAITHANRYYSYYQINPMLINPNDFTNKIKPDRTKIFCINDINTFDIFTKKYSEAYMDPEKDYYLRINWDRVSKDFKGFYLDNNTILRLSRNEYAPFGKDKRGISWMPLEKISMNVMMFK